MNNERALNFAQVAEILTVHKATVYRLVGSGQLKAVNVSPGRKVVLQSELDRYLKSLK